jgi:hypothetical protein
MSCVAHTCSIEFEVYVCISSLSLHEELHTAVFMHIVPIPRGECTQILTIDNIGQVKSLVIVAQIGCHERAMREVLSPVKGIDIEYLPLLTEQRSDSL